jgi:hypothetical protein
MITIHRLPVHIFLLEKCSSTKQFFFKKKPKTEKATKHVAKCHNKHKCNKIHPSHEVMTRFQRDKATLSGMPLPNSHAWLTGAKMLALAVMVTASGHHHGTTASSHIVDGTAN